MHWIGIQSASRAPYFLWTDSTGIIMLVSCGPIDIYWWMNEWERYSIFYAWCLQTRSLPSGVEASDTNCLPLVCYLLPSLQSRYNISLYGDCQSVNTEVVHQTNSDLCKLKSSLSNMNRSNFISHLKFFLYYCNKKYLHAWVDFIMITNISYPFSHSLIAYVFNMF